MTKRMKTIKVTVESNSVETLDMKMLLYGIKEYLSKLWEYRDCGEADGLVTATFVYVGKEPVPDEVQQK